MSIKSRITNRHVVAIVIVVVSVAILYLVLANLLFARTYEMLAASMKARGESNVSRLAELVSWGLAANSKKDVTAAIETFRKGSPETLAIVVLDANRKPFARAGQQDDPTTILGAFEKNDAIASRMKDGQLVAIAPSRSEFIDKPVGYVIYSESAFGYLKYRQNMFVIALLASVLGLVIVGKLLHAQISVSIENAKLLVSLEKQAMDLRASNQSLQAEIEVRIRTEAELAQYRLHLEELVEQRTLELKKTKDRLVDASRKAGMAEVATGVLHNVGNILNSVNVAGGLIKDMVSGLHIESLQRAVTMMQEHAEDLGAFVTQDKKGMMLPKYLAGLADTLEHERSGVLGKVDDLTQKVDQIKVIVSLQQSYAGLGGATEKCVLKDIIEDAIQINMAALERHRTELRRDFHTTPELLIEKQKVIQILVNLLSNAKYAMKPLAEDQRIITVRTRVADENNVEIIVEDNGVGIPQENLTRIFQYGFTTRKEGHGFGLHSSANAATELGGTLQAHSDGAGAGAKFVLKIPVLQPGGQHG
jgi:signal transduction histidine kinase